MAIKEQVLGALTSDWEAAGRIASIANLNYYRVKVALDELVTEGQAETLQSRTRIKYRRLPATVAPEPSQLPQDNANAQTPTLELMES